MVRLRIWMVGFLALCLSVSVIGCGPGTPEQTDPTDVPDDGGDPALDDDVSNPDAGDDKPPGAT